MDRSKRREQMRRLLERRERYGLTFRELAEQSGESPGTLAWWNHRFRRERPGRRSRGFVELVARGPAREAGRADLEVVLGCGRRIVVGRDFDEAALRRVVAALEGGC
jgi:hypothetical protein